MQNEKRKYYIDYLRVLSAIAVILCHIDATAKTDFPSFESSIEYFVYSIVHSLSLFAVPVFLMISGALLLSRDKEISTKKLLKSYLLKYIIIIVFVGSFYSILEIVFISKSFKFSYILNAFMNAISGKSWEHLWYIYTYIGILLILPMLKVFINNSNEKSIKYFIYVALFATSIVPHIKLLTNININIQYPIATIYPIYLFVGYALENDIIRINRKCCVLLILSISLLKCVNICLGAKNGISIPIDDYNSPIMVIYSASIFGLFKTLNFETISNKRKDIVRNISNLCLGVYLFHMFWINLAYKFFDINPYASLLLGLIVAIATLLLSLLMTYFIRRITVPLEKKYLK